MNATPTVGIANTTCGLPRADAMSVLRDPSTGDYPWPSMILQCGLASAWYWICDQVNFLKKYTCSDPEGGGTRGPVPGKITKIGFLSNRGPDPLKNHKATKPAFNVGPS